MTPRKAIRRKCLYCCLNSREEVNLCPVEACGFWPYRFGKKPARLRVIRQKCLECSGSAQNVKDCFAYWCPVFSYRFGKTLTAVARMPDVVARGQINGGLADSMTVRAILAHKRASFIFNPVPKALSGASLPNG